MGDIAQDLRDWQDYEPVKAFAPEMLADLERGAAEIERLRAEKAKLWGLLAESVELAADLTDPKPPTSALHIYARAVELRAKVRGLEQSPPVTGKE